MIKALNKSVFTYLSDGKSPPNWKNRPNLPVKKPKALVSASKKLALTPRYKKKIIKPLSMHKRGFSETPSALLKNNNRMIFSVKTSAKSSCEKLYSPDFHKKVFQRTKKSISPLFKSFGSLKNQEKACDKHSQNPFEKGYSKNGNESFFTIKSEINRQNYDKALGLIEKSIRINEVPELVYLRSICYLNLNSFDDALKGFLHIKSMKTFLQPGVFLGIFKCYEQLGNYDEALKALNLGVKYYPDNIQGVFIRGKFLVEHKKYDIAIKDLKKLKSSEAYWLLFICWKNKRNYSNALKYLKKYGNGDHTNHKYLQELGKLDYKLKNYESSVQSLTSSLNLEEENLETFYYIGKAKQSLGEYEDSELFLEKVAQNTVNNFLATRAIYKLAYLKQKQSDFYGSYQTLYRKSVLLSSFTKNCLSIYIEATYFLIQNNFIEAIDLFGQLVDMKSEYPTLYSCLIFRGFTFLSNGEFGKSIEDYEEAKKIDELDGSSEFNYRMALAMMKYEEKKYSEVLEMLDSDFFDNFLNPMPSILRIHCNILNQMSRDYSFISSLTEAYNIKTHKLDSEVYYLRALLSYFSNNYEESIEYVNKCIFQTDKNLCSIYTLRGFCYIKLKIYSQAFEDFNMAITINGSLENLYAYRGMCAYFAGKNNLAIEDFLYASNSLDPNGFILSIYLLIVVGDVKDAIGLLEMDDGRFGNMRNDKEDQENEELVCCEYENGLLKAHCCLLIENYEQCGEILGKFEMTDEIKNDIYTVYNLSKKKIKSKGPGVLFPSKYSVWFQAVDMFYKKDYDGAITLLEQTLNLFQANQIDILFQNNIIIEEEHCEILYNIGLANFMKNTYVKII